MAKARQVVLALFVRLHCLKQRIETKHMHAYVTDSRCDVVLLLPALGLVLHLWLLLIGFLSRLS